MKTTFNKTLVVITVITAMALGSCQKEKLNPVHSSKNAQAIDEISNETQAIALSLDISKLSFKNEDGGLIGTSDMIGDCATITRDENNMPMTVTFNYGTGCVGNDGKTRSGKIVVTYNNSDIKVAGTYMTLSFEGFAINGKEYTGQCTYRNNGWTVSRQPKYTYVVSCIMTSAQNEGLSEVNGSFFGEWLTGSSTLTEEDDKFSMKGSATGKDFYGNDITFNITSALIKKGAAGCDIYFVQGKSVTTITGEANTYIDYGNGTCDNIATLTQNGVTETITLD